MVLREGDARLRNENLLTSIIDPAIEIAATQIKSAVADWEKVLTRVGEAMPKDLG
jgi:hypothetical protein